MLLIIWLSIYQEDVLHLKEEELKLIMIDKYKSKKIYIIEYISIK